MLERVWARRLGRERATIGGNRDLVDGAPDMLARVPFLECSLGLAYDSRSYCVGLDKARQVADRFGLEIDQPNLDEASIFGRFATTCDVTCQAFGIAALVARSVAARPASPSTWTETDRRGTTSTRIVPLRENDVQLYSHIGSEVQWEELD